MAVHEERMQSILLRDKWNRKEKTGESLTSDSNVIQIAQYSFSKRGRRMLLINGYTFTKNCETNHKTRWRCSLRSCSARVHTVDDVIVLALLDHKHPPKALEKYVTTNLSVYELDMSK
ncbi:hypothetical protein HF086_014277 [Spodoptera exigua]|uniref:FLYWCH-type domain-containing protein n=1 Tax=Spodoptera exigua TaxID=7107 RepID=A0A922M7S8_SPOEX|nr:hypothetical protein HF086_014277 [Spodoptera exigua]